jgi:broad specificity phosphatase PhoE
MPILRLFALALLVLASACATAPADPAPEPVYFVMRHLHTPEGERDPDLTEEGRRQAALLADRLAPEGPMAIHVSDYRRTRQTAAPLAARLGLTPIVYDPADTAGLVARVRAGPSPVLIVGHSNTVPEIIAQLGGARPAPLVHADFGDLWRIGPDGATARTRIDAP